MKKKLNIPKFKNNQQERKFWSKINLADHFEVSDFEPVIFPNLKPTTQPISIRLPINLLNKIKEKANEMAVPYQALIKIWLQKAALS